MLGILLTAGVRVAPLPLPGRAGDETLAAALIGGGRLGSDSGSRDSSGRGVDDAVGDAVGLAEGDREGGGLVYRATEATLGGAGPACFPLTTRSFTVCDDPPFGRDMGDSKRAKLTIVVRTNVGSP